MEPLLLNYRQESRTHWSLPGPRSILKVWKNSSSLCHPILRENVIPRLSLYSNFLGAFSGCTVRSVQCLRHVRSAIVPGLQSCLHSVLKDRIEYTLLRKRGFQDISLSMYSLLSGSVAWIHSDFSFEYQNEMEREKMVSRSLTRFFFYL